jgi:peptide chain release factor 2
MGDAGFWDSQEKAQKVINQLKPLNGLLKPFQELTAAVSDIGALAELSDEDATLEPELDREVGKT